MRERQQGRRSQAEEIARTETLWDALKARRLEHGGQGERFQMTLARRGPDFSRTDSHESDFGFYPKTNKKSLKVSLICVYKIPLVAGETVSAVIT